MKKILRILKIQYLGGHRLYLEFNNGDSGEIDLSSDLNGPIFQPLRDSSLFGCAKIEGGALAWPNGADIAPEYLAKRIVKQDAASNAHP
ncbi:DUF2442 domain-containing protein [Kamptonema cortianum]|nr:DUF2442 domain-containing protein [Oscillatoria laete-virens]MDK3159479.1 DUF2442 domain-containing protein [Kamptonema cortianum]MDL5044553.1 DUF2442 domain-containing protein [Oscillatoria amoena NRMC-F 0135]MDL5053019.1 DUF2442 domain-containing protein [Oscillatoria laete-virens NRMC-F 0139]